MAEKPKILVVEDNVSWMEAWKDFLRLLDFDVEVVEAWTWQQAINLLGTEIFLAVISDGMEENYTKIVKQAKIRNVNPYNIFVVSAYLGFTGKRDADGVSFLSKDQDVMDKITIQQTIRV